MLADELCVADDPQQAADNPRALMLTRDFNASDPADDVQVGPNVQFLTPTHPVEPEVRRAKWEAARPISVGDNVWRAAG